MFIPKYTLKQSHKLLVFVYNYGEMNISDEKGGLPNDYHTFPCPGMAKNSFSTQTYKVHFKSDYIVGCF